MSTVSACAFCEALYCSCAAWEAFSDAPSGRIEFTAFTTDCGVHAFYRVQFVGVRDFRWRREGEPARASTPPRDVPDDRLELSDIDLERDGDGWRFWCDPWYVHEVEFRCAAIYLNGAEVTGTGRWLQDGLPERPPVVPVFPGTPPASVAALLGLPGAA